MIQINTVPSVPSTEYSAGFLQGMVTRMEMSFCKYGAVADAYPNKVDAIASLKRRLEKYEETGNTEYLMDAGNFCMIEFMCPKHPNAYFKAEDSANSIGRVHATGIESQAANTIQRESQRVGGFYKRDGD